MGKLIYTFKSDVLFKMVFVKYPELLKIFIAEILGIQVDKIGEFTIRNPEIPPEELGNKYCRLDINMTVDGRRVDLEIQVAEQDDYLDRSLFYWARDFSTALASGKAYGELPQTIVISIMDFELFQGEEVHSEFQALEVKRHTPLTDKMVLHYYELSKLPKAIDAKDRLGLWLALFNAETEEDLEQIAELEVTEMGEAIQAYQAITGTEEYRRLQQMREDALHNEASALRQERAKWERAVAEVAEITKKNEALEEALEGAVADKDAVVADMQAEIARLRALLDK
jgi:predicted transposase/invertase (TIGR01784 family)